MAGKRALHIILFNPRHLNTRPRRESEISFRNDSCSIWREFLMSGGEIITLRCIFRKEDFPPATSEGTNRQLEGTERGWKESPKMTPIMASLNVFFDEPI
ncbi:hypothetical protein HNY73_009753 [Argiope bruennichi]|uniref:Uncharacterized protein n=1 Tax=Argiope bruennichi TaxID=94029 RepID=A0A8T0FD24_ARGBR|nr:hypothetical protein HNY73_009753 [Argiope bruennichi]